MDSARAAAAYVVRFADGRSETWNTWFHVTDGKWFPSAAARETRVNGFYGLPRLLRRRGDGNSPEPLSLA